MFVISDGEIRWHQWDDKSIEVVRKYVVIEQTAGTEALLVEGGSKVSWYAHWSTPNAQHKLTLSANHSNQYASKSIELKDAWLDVEKDAWRSGGSMFVTRIDGSCP